MAQKPDITDDIVIADGQPLNLRNRHLAATLAWLVPGAGHYYQQRRFKAAIFFFSIVTLFVMGLVVSGGRCVYASWNGIERRWQYGLQAGVGLPAMPAAVQAWRKRGGNEPFLKGWYFDRNDPAPFAAPDRVFQLDQWHKQTASGFDLGTLYTMIAGLLNILAIYDAFSGPLPPPRPKSKTDSNPDAVDMGESKKSKGA